MWPVYLYDKVGFIYNTLNILNENFFKNGNLWIQKNFEKIDKKICFLHEKNRITTNKNNFPWNKKKINK